MHKTSVVHLLTATLKNSQFFNVAVNKCISVATGVGGEKCDWQHSLIAHPWKPHYRRRNLADSLCLTQAEL